ncbi:MAG TPA: hypothetical protein VFU21_09605 [Kofleriaceae bacterium]|nr:hypothetical protein [Kofleriaceae bacterium]
MRSPLALCRLIALLLAAGSAGLVVYLAPGWEMWATPARAAVTAGLGLAVIAALAALWRGSPGRRAVGAVLLLAGCALLVLDLAGMRVTAIPVGPVPYQVLIAAVTGLAGLGVLLRRRFARWVGLAVGAAGAASSGMNLQLWIAAGVVDGSGWTFAIWTLGGALMLVTLGGRDVAAGDRLAAREEVWRARDPLVFWTRAATVTAVIACPMLLVYGFMQEGAAPALTAPAAVLAAYLAIAAGLAGHGKALGAALLAIGALGLAAMTAAVFALRPAGEGTRIAAFYLPFFAPAAAAGLTAGALLLRAAIRSPAGPGGGGPGRARPAAGCRPSGRPPGRRRRRAARRCSAG